MEWKDLTIEQAQFIYSLTQSITDDHSLFEAQVKALAYLTNTPEEEVNSWSLDKYHEKLKVIDFMFKPIPELKPRQRFKVNGQRYFISYNMQDVSYGQYNEVMEYSKGEGAIINNLHKLMASFVFPLKWFKVIRKKNHARISEDMKKAPFVACYSAAVFFYQVYNNSLKAIRPYLENELQQKGVEKKEAARTVAALLTVMDGFTPQKN